MRFIDLFAGLGGFHLALRQLGHTCVFACELDETLRRLYTDNFGIEPAGDIRKIDLEKIPAHDILCAGFPCQPFSKAGDQSGFDDPESGNLFYYIVRILEIHKPRFFILENVANFEKHDRGRTWKHAKSLLENAGYEVQIRKLSPHMFGIPQIRERVIIVGSRDGLSHFRWPEPTNEPTTIHSVLEHNPSDARPLPPQVRACIEVWQEFLDRFPADEELPSFPIWSMEFGATYPFEDVTPYAVGVEGLRGLRGSHGRLLEGSTEQELFALLPSYARTKETKFPSWKVRFIRQNREFYQKHKRMIDEWLPKILPFPPSYQKFEWNCKGEVRDLSKHVLQLRASGLRVKRPTTAPSLVAMTSTQVPIIPWENRYMTPRECARLQNMDTIKLPDSLNAAYKALGNAVNVKVVKLVAQALLSLDEAQAADWRSSAIRGSRLLHDEISRGTNAKSHHVQDRRRVTCLVSGAYIESHTGGKWKPYLCGQLTTEEL